MKKVTNIDDRDWNRFRQALLDMRDAVRHGNLRDIDNNLDIAMSLASRWHERSLMLAEFQQREENKI